MCELQEQREGAHGDFGVPKMAARFENKFIKFKCWTLSVAESPVRYHGLRSQLLPCPPAAALRGIVEIRAPGSAKSMTRRPCCSQVNVRRHFFIRRRRRLF